MDATLETAIKAIELYAAMHPRPPHVTQSQAAEMLGVSKNTVCARVKAGAIKLNKMGFIPITEIDRLLAA